jgi:hypothetical protein
MLQSFSFGKLLVIEFQNCQRFFPQIHLKFLRSTSLFYTAHFATAHLLMVKFVRLCGIEVTCNTVAAAGCSLDLFNKASLKSFVDSELRLIHRGRSKSCAENHALQLILSFTLATVTAILAVGD